MLALFQKLFKEEEGQTLTEYGLIIGLVALVVIAAVMVFGGELVGLWEKLSGIITTVELPKK